MHVAEQLRGLSDEQQALWREPSRSDAGGGVVVHEARESDRRASRGRARRGRARNSRASRP